MVVYYRKFLLHMVGWVAREPNYPAISWTETYKYDEEGNETEEVRYDPSGKIKTKSTPQVRRDGELV